MPRFTDVPHQPPPRPESEHVEFSCDGRAIGTIGKAELAAIGPRDVVADFHCVTTWSVTGLRWTGVPLVEVLESLGITGGPGQYLVAQAADHRRSVFVWEDAVAPDVLLATHLNGEPLGDRHGGPVRLVAPGHYGYKSVKHLTSIDRRSVAPRSLGKEHLRGRVALEERHPTLPSWLVRFPYRLLIPPTAAIAEHSLERARSSGIRLANAEHHADHWIINQIAPDFVLEDAWRLPTPGGAEDFAVLLDVMAARDRSESPSLAARSLFRVRELLGTCFGWDDNAHELPIPGCAETSLAARLPEHLRVSAEGSVAASSIFTPLFRTEDEWAAEVSNATVHAVMHLAWVDQGEGHFTAQMGVYVKSRGRFGGAYMALIRPFRHRIVYPAMMRQLESAWSSRQPQ